MDWTKAKTILIIALVLTNLFLILSIIDRHKEAGEDTNEAALMQILESRNIDVNCEIPKSHPDMSPVRGEFLSVAPEDAVALEQRMPRVDVHLPKEGEDASGFEAAYRASAEDFLEYLGVMDDEVNYAGYTNILGAGNVNLLVKFENVVNGVKVDGNYINIYYSEGKIVDFVYRWLDSPEFAESKAETISAQVALMSLTNSAASDAEKMQIENIEMVYWMPDIDISYNQKISDTAFPAWKFTLKNGENVYVDAV